MIASPALKAPQLEKVRLAIGLKSTAQSLALVGLAAGSFREAGIALEISGMETAGPAGIKGLVEGDWDIAEFGAVPVVQWALEGHDPLILLAAEPRPALFIVGAPDVKEPAQLRGREIGVLTAAGQTGYCAAQMLGRWGLSAADVSIASLKRYPVIFDMVRTGRIAAGVLPADYRFAAAPSEGLSALADLSEEFEFQGPVVVTTKRLAAARPDLVSRIVEGYSRALHAFKTRPDVARATLRAHLDFTDEAGVARIHEFYAPRFSRIPRASPTGLQNVLNSFADEYPAAASMGPQEVYDSTFLDALERDGLFDRLYDPTGTSAGATLTGITP
ncbi:ABC-type nitrate/sulfonate/bicarbonate transport system substrate-binding protein [Bradyrhizobium sp. USDA 4501]